MSDTRLVMPLTRNIPPDAEIDDDSPDVSPARRSEAFRKTRAARQTETMEDYVELIGDLIAATGEARLTDLARQIGVSHPTAAKAVARLRAQGLIENRPYRSLFLTADGHAMADRSRQRHRVVYAFLRAIGVSERVAEADAEGIEHHVSKETMAALISITAKLVPPH